MENSVSPVVGSLYSFLDERDTLRLRDAGSERSYAANEVLMHEGDPTDHVHILLAGWVRVSTLTDDGTEILFALRGPGDVIGELAAILGMPRSVTVRTIEPVKVLQVRGPVFVRCVREQPDLSLAVIKSIATRLRDAEAVRVDITTMDVTRRLALYLLRLARDHGTPGPEGISVEMPLTQLDIANHVGASLRAVARSMAMLRDRGIISNARKRYTIAKPAVLRSLIRTAPTEAD
ncbi:Crp/Fnr family transcriptional regulator [Actinokineospora auranticolor]|uniref:CRP-like cAMP-binding protein n=1 Tax=Actinokineospora auranticolor TaxID=155976 RepID=A0A2S6GDM3_9PSEU|nr:Crp/Fnr family transcriptional regulator [Actinokineospora auranticolor]PPK63231.1 CRP-like cAMP-binding protein [Actinokineospora auranticolor]